MQSGTKQVPCRVFLASEAVLATSRLAQRENWQREKEGTPHMEIGPCTESSAPMNHPPPSPCGECAPGADLAHGNFSPKVKYYLEANDKQNLFLQWSCLEYFPLIPLK